MNDNELITAKQAAERLGISSRRVVALINAKRLPAQKMGNTWVIRAADLHLVEDREVGNPNWRRGGDSSHNLAQ